MTAFQLKQLEEIRKERAARNPVIACEKFGTNQDVLMGTAGSITCTAKEDGRFLIQLIIGGSFRFQKFYATKEDARKGWLKAKSFIK